MLQINRRLTGEIEDVIIQIAPLDAALPGTADHGMEFARKQRRHIVEPDFIGEREQTVFLLKAGKRRRRGIQLKFDFDQRRSGFLHEQGIRVVRFENNLVRADVDGIVAEIIRIEDNDTVLLTAFPKLSAGPSSFLPSIHSFFSFFPFPFSRTRK